MFSQFQKYWAQQEREEKEAISPTQPENSPPGLLQSKSSGNLTSKPRVRFMDETQLGNTPTGVSIQAQFASLNIEGKANKTLFQILTQNTRTDWFFHIL